jgi:hypothetical protein
MRIDRKECTGLVVDIQDRLFPHMSGKDALLKRCLILLEGLKVLQIPLLVTEQYPSGLGSTIEQVRRVLEPQAIIEKTAFSCCGEPAFRSALVQSGRSSVIICGIEAHVCILQTAVDLLEEGYLPVVVADCTGSRDPADKEIALERMRAEGAVISSCESILFELARVAGTDQFKAISRLVK